MSDRRLVLSKAWTEVESHPDGAAGTASDRRGARLPPDFLSDYKHPSSALVKLYLEGRVGRAGRG
jgi:hypothetical protein